MMVIAPTRGSSGWGGGEYQRKRDQKKKSDTRRGRSHRSISVRILGCKGEEKI